MTISSKAERIPLLSDAEAMQCIFEVPERTPSPERTQQFLAVPVILQRQGKAFHDLPLMNIKSVWKMNAAAFLYRLLILLQFRQLFTLPSCKVFDDFLLVFALIEAVECHLIVFGNAEDLPGFLIEINIPRVRIIQSVDYF